MECEWPAYGEEYYSKRLSHATSESNLMAILAAIAIEEDIKGEYDG